LGDEEVMLGRFFKILGAKLQLSLCLTKSRTAVRHSGARGRTFGGSNLRYRKTNRSLSDSPPRRLSSFISVCNVKEMELGKQETSGNDGIVFKRSRTRMQ